MSSGKVKVKFEIGVPLYTAMLRALRLHGSTTKILANRIENNVKQQQRRQQRRASNANA